ncbi:hybrid sensor histidine kinase/response regulator [Pseudomonas sp. SIMBA_041]|uniref:ATP-binding response regulator n=3 Tax=Pseudomonadati TaxID=3379134 RepID=UPI00397B4804
MTFETMKKISDGIFELFVPPPAFPEKKVEATFLTTHSKKHLLQRRLFLLMAITLWCVFSYWDYHHKVHHQETFTWNIFVYVIALRSSGAIFIVYACAKGFGDYFLNEKKAAILIVVTVSVSIICLTLMMSLVPAPLNYQYYFVGVVLVLFFQYGTMALLAKYSLFTTALSIFLLIIQDVIHSPLGIYFFPAIFYLLSFATLGWAVSVRFERAAREGFLASQELKVKNRSLEKSNAGMLRERRKADKALQELFDKEIQKAHTARDRTEATARFVRAAYHDTMQPLASIANLAVAGGKAVEQSSPEELARIFKEISTSGREIDMLFRGLRDVFMIGETLPVIEPVSINNLLEEIEQVYRSRAIEKGLDLRVVKRKLDVFINSDAQLIKRIVGNLTSNAIKYTHKGGVLVGSVAGKATIRIDIIDTGIGVPDKYKQRIFEEFFQVGNQSRNAEMGLGLGLYIVRNFISNLPGHRISFSSLEKRGSRFSIDCPLHTESVILSDALVRPSDANDVNLQGAYIMLVDDDSRILNSLAKTFELFGAIVVTAPDLLSVKKLLSSAPDRQPDILVTDYNLGEETTGLDVIEMVRSYYDWATVPVIIFSAESLPDLTNKEKMLVLISKGSEATTLLHCVHELVATGRAANALPSDEDSTPST